MYINTIIKTIIQIKLIVTIMIVAFRPAMDDRGPGWESVCHPRTRLPTAVSAGRAAARRDSSTRPPSGRGKHVGVGGQEA